MAFWSFPILNRNTCQASWKSEIWPPSNAFLFYNLDISFCHTIRNSLVIIFPVFMKRTNLFFFRGCVGWIKWMSVVGRGLHVNAGETNRAELLSSEPRLFYPACNIKFAVRENNRKAKQIQTSLNHFSKTETMIETEILWQELLVQLWGWPPITIIH